MEKKEIRLVADYHMHTYYSDGKESVDAMVRASIQKGLECIAFTDHGPGHMAHGVRKREELYRDVQQAKEKYAGKITILYGIEANIMTLDGRIDVEENLKHPYEIILMGYHKTALTFRSALHFYGGCLFPFTHKKAVEKTTLAYIRAIERYPIDIIVHPNYATWVNVDELSKATAKHHVALEINGHHNFMSQKELKQAKANGAIFTINSDAHTTDRVGDTSRAIGDAIEAGIGPELIANTAEGPRLNCFLKEG